MEGVEAQHPHYPQAKAAIEAGKHVVREKPLTMNSQESAELLHLAREAGIVHAVNHNIRFYPMWQEAQTRAIPPDFPTFADGHEEILLCEAIERSAQERQWVEIDR